MSPSTNAVTALQELPPYLNEFTAPPCCIITTSFVIGFLPAFAFHSALVGASVPPESAIIKNVGRLGLPAGPVGPVGPVEPAGPVGPVEPAGPVGPVDPSEPSEPSEPAGPVGPVGPANEKLPASDKAPELAVYFKWLVLSPKKKLPVVSIKKPLSLSVNEVLFGVLKVPPLANVIVLPTLKLFVKFVFAVILSALSVPSTITEPSKCSTTKLLKSEASASDAVAVAGPVYTRVPDFCALLSVTSILSFGRIVLSAAALIK